MDISNTYFFINHQTIKTMKKNIYRWLAGAMSAAAMCLSAQNAQAQVEYVDDYICIEDFSIAPGQTAPLTVWINSYCTWQSAITHVELPKGLVIEKIDPEEVDPEAFTFGYLCINPNDNTRDYVALSRDFADPSYMDEDYLSELESERKQDPTLETMCILGYCFINGNDACTVVQNDNYWTDVHNGMHPLLQYRVRATDELEDNAVITTRVLFVGNKLQGYVGQEINNQFNGTPKECRVRLVVDPEVNADVNGDGTVDIDDVNIVVNEMLRK